MNKKFSILLLFCSLISGAQVPDTDLWLFDLTCSKTGQYTIEKGRNITSRKGYDNQPFFSKDGSRIYFVGIGEDKQADIFSFKISSKKTERITSTPVSEYSPRLTDDEVSFYCVMVEADSTQRVHRIELEKKTDVFVSAFDSVGYCTFLNSDTAVYYKLTEPHSLRYHVISSGEDKWLANSPIRSIIKLNRHEVLYGIKAGNHVTLFSYDMLLQKAVKYADDDQASDNFLVHKQFGLLRSANNRISRFDKTSGTWIDLFDLSAAGLKNVTRFAIDEKGKYLVVAENYPDK